MKSIKRKIFSIVLSGIISSSVIVGGFGIFWSSKTIKNDSQKMLDLMSEAQTVNLDSMFKDIEQSSIVLAHYVEENLEDFKIFHADDKFSRYFGKLENIAFYIVNCTLCASSVYIRFAPELTDEVSSLMWTRVNGSFERKSLPSFPVYDSDFDNSWYYKARCMGCGVWTKPYYNEDLNKYVISYSVPVYKNGFFFAVVGMDIEFADIISVVNSISLYDTGYAFLTDEDFIILYHRQLPLGTRIFREISDIQPIKGSNNYIEFYKYTYKNKKFQMTYKNLENKMKLVISVPQKEIDLERNELIIAIIIAVLLITILLSFVSSIMSNRLTRPLKELAESAHTIVTGNYNVNFDKRPDDEIGELMTIFMFMAKSLKVQFDYINSLVYLDSMTGAKNKRSYIDAKKELEAKIKAAILSDLELDFAIIVFDVNDLKIINDNFGHKAGDLLIKTACKLITQTFSNSSVYRIGGDEFVLILTGKDYDNRIELLAKLKSDMDCPIEEKNEAFEKISIAAGMAVFNPSEDSNFQTVFERADKEMYKAKVKMKGGEKNVR